MVDHDHGFTLVKSRRKNHRGFNTRHRQNNTDTVSGNHNHVSDDERNILDVDINTFERKLAKTHVDICTTEAVQHILTQVMNWYAYDGSDKNICNSNFDVVCYGLGNFFSSVEAREQFVSLKELRKLQSDGEQRYYCYDPKFTLAEQSYLGYHHYSLIPDNEEGKRGIEQCTVFYMPHCGIALSNNLLWSNWTHQQMEKILVIGNKFTAVRDRMSSHRFEKFYSFINQILPYTVESPVPVTEETLCAFSDTAVMYFHNLPPKDDAFWAFREEEPEYDDGDVEIIRA